MLKKIIIPVVAAAAFALVAPANADASPIKGLDSQIGNAYGPKIRIGGGITIPIGGPRVSRVRHVHSGGYYKTVYETRTTRVWHPPELVGYDSHGHPVYSKGHYDLVTERIPVRVWVPYTTTHVVRHYPRARGHISIGGVWRIR